MTPQSYLTSKSEVTYPSSLINVLPFSTGSNPQYYIVSVANQNFISKSCSYPSSLTPFVDGELPFRFLTSTSKRLFIYFLNFLFINIIFFWPKIQIFKFSIV